ncbi:hypothetical protein GB928_000700 [Shinella curvata]|uniref:DUF4240 domain-containing protein n=1 Tax=Shinella curvata TaxID=1817964 RepID=A0ABT8X7I3_9HYPH|nr:hypothetical protein [Shinella curvata]MCJ8052359.1 hypothetical protein [Shinella curvata]MDO6119692.1 hypothetical protein [Shinella curvata]
MAATVISLFALAVIIWVLWAAFRANAKARRNPQRIESTIRTEDERRRIAMSLRDRLSREPLGSALAERLWQRLMTEEPNNGLIYDRHRDFCGQGLIRTLEGVMLADVQDGGSYFGAAIAEWATERDFVAFFTRQSDFSMSGWDAGEPVFFTEDDWYRNNQRLTRAVMERYLSRL